VVGEGNAVFRSLELKNLRPMPQPAFTAPLPAAVADALGWKNGAPRLAGAYQE
jgi:hypothetical protein